MSRILEELIDASYGTVCDRYGQYAKTETEAIARADQLLQKHIEIAKTAPVWTLPSQTLACTEGSGFRSDEQ